MATAFHTRTRLLDAAISPSRVLESGDRLAAIHSLGFRSLMNRLVGAPLPRFAKSSKFFGTRHARLPVGALIAACDDRRGKHSDIFIRISGRRHLRLTAGSVNPPLSPCDAAATQFGGDTTTSHRPPAAE